MLAAGASAEMIVLAVEAAYVVEAQRKERHASYMREWRHVNSRELTKERSPTPPKEKLPPISPSEKYAPRGDFDQFWDVYPRKKAKRSALKAFSHALKRAQASEILAGAERYSASKPDPQFTKHAATWLNSDCWLDEPDKPKASNVVTGSFRKEFAPEPVRNIPAEEKAANLRKLMKARPMP
jgi:hypothetical protein